jgi:cytochrome c-type biogenesis protein CcmH
MVAVLLLALGPAVALAADPDEMLKDPRLEARAEAIGNNLRCLVCQNESIEASGADLAHQLRVLVRQRLKEGDTDQQVIDYLVSRYGEFVLLKPVFAWHTLALWGAAPTVIVIGAITLFVLARRRRPVGPAELTAEEAEALERLRDAEAPAE